MEGFGSVREAALFRTERLTDRVIPFLTLVFENRGRYHGVLLGFLALAFWWTGVTDSV
jgi:hypothetical protein